MWKVLPRLGLFKVIFFVFSILLLSTLILVLESGANSTATLSWGEFGQAIKLVTPVTLGFIVLVYLIGKWIWKLFWNMPVLGKILNRYLCPDLNGDWSGYVESNFPRDDELETKKPVKLCICADLFGFSIDLKSEDNYQSSKVVQSEIYRDPRTNIFYVSYIFEANVLIPEETDDRVFDGAGRLKVKFEDDDIRLEGIYWTNRAWQRKLNTAGIIKLNRI